MRPPLFSLTLLSLCCGLVSAQQEPVSKTGELKESVREWIETMREVQREEDAWERDRVLLEDQRAALRSEIADLTERVAEARTAKDGAEKESLDEVERRDAYLAARELLATELRGLERSAVARIPSLPAPLAGEPRIKELIGQIRQDASLTGDKATEGLSKRLNNVINLLTEAEKWQQTVHLRDELHEAGDGRKFNLKVAYFGLASAYGVSGGGDFAVVGRPGEDGWTFEERNDLAERIAQMIDVLNGDADARFVELPFELQ